MKYLGFVLLVLSSNVMAEEVYYCSDNHNGSNGYWKNKQTGQYEPSSFNESKFKMKLQDDGNIAIDNPNISAGKDLYLCSTPYKGYTTEMPNNKSCVHEYHNGWSFNFNQDNGRYILFKGYGYVFGDGDSVSTHIGTCTKF
jgi:hypothetical protein